LNFDGTPPFSPHHLSLSSLFWRSFSHPSTNQAWPCLASEIRQDWACLGWYGNRLKIFLDWSFLSLLVRIHFFLDLFVCFWCHITGGSNKQIRWASVPTRPFWPNLSNKEA
jgi:hypothetical protein